MYMRVLKYENVILPPPYTRYLPPKIPLKKNPKLRDIYYCTYEYHMSRHDFTCSMYIEQSSIIETFTND